MKERTLPFPHQKNMKMLDNITGTCISKKISAFQKENAQGLLCCRLSFLNVLFTTTTLAYSRHHHLSLHFIVVIKRRFYLPRQNKNMWFLKPTLNLQTMFPCNQHKRYPTKETIYHVFMNELDIWTTLYDIS